VSGCASFVGPAPRGKEEEEEEEGEEEEEEEFTPTVLSPCCGDFGFISLINKFGTLTRASP